MLLDVGNIVRMNRRGGSGESFRIGAFFLLLAPGALALSFSSQAPSQTASPALAAQSAVPQALPTAPPQAVPQVPLQAVPRAGLNIVVLDPAHGGTDPGARGTAAFARAKSCWTLPHKCAARWSRKDFKWCRRARGMKNPSFDDRSAMANAQTGAVFVTLHMLLRRDCQGRCAFT